MTLSLLSALFLLLCAIMAAAVMTLFSRYLAGRDRVVAVAVFTAWLLYAGILGYAGVIASKRPPGPAFLLLPFLLFMELLLVRHPAVRLFAQRIPFGLLLGLQIFRVFVELTLHELYKLHLVPRLMTFEAGNLDILIGLTAPLVAWLYTTGRMNPNLVRLWSFVGIAMLANIVLRTILTFPGALNVIHTDVPDVAIGMFPFTCIPGFLAPLALSLHVLALRSLPNPSRTKAQSG